MANFVRKFAAFAYSVWPIILFYVAVVAIVTFGVLHSPKANAASEACYTVAENIGIVYDTVKRAPEGTDLTPLADKIAQSSLPPPQKFTLIQGLIYLAQRGDSPPPKAEFQQQAAAFCAKVEAEIEKGNI